MAYTPVPAIAAGDTIDEVFLMTYWVDNMAAMVPDMFSAKGQLAVGLGVDSMGVLDVGANGQVLVSNSGSPLGVKWASIGQTTILGKSASQTIPSSSTADITWDVESRDDEGLHSLAANTERITFTQNGLYLLCCSIILSSGGGTDLSIKKNGSTVLLPTIIVSGTGKGQSIFPLLFSVLANDYIQATLTTNALTGVVTTSSSLAVIRMGD